MRLKHGVVVALLPFLGACTTFMGHTQRMKIATQPEGAKIIYKNKVLSISPAFVDIPRSKESEITLERQGYPPLKKTLNSSYRWGDSFFSNFVWLFWGQPLASFVDYETDTSWDFDKLGVIPLGTSLTPEKPTSPKIIAIAPPQSDYELLSDELGGRVQQDAHKHFPGAEIVPFHQTHHLFEKYSYSNSSKTDEDNVDNLYDQLKSTHLLESRVELQDDGVLLQTSLVDIYTDQKSETFEELIPGAQLKNSKPSFKNFMASLLSAVPNLLTFDLDTPSSDLQIKSGVASDAYKGVSDRSQTFLAYFSSLGIRSARPPKIVHGIKGVIRLAPALSFAYDRFHFEKGAGATNAFAGYSFDWYTFIAGIGPEVGFDTHVGYFYADFIPAYSINWITGQNTNQEASSRVGSLTAMAEVGYEIFASSRINMRLFFRAVGIPPNSFSNLLPSLTGQNVEVDSVTRNVGGLSVGYYFPEDRSFVKGLLF